MSTPPASVASGRRPFGALLGPWASQIGISAAFVLLWAMFVVLAPRTFLNVPIYQSFAQTTPFFAIVAMPLTMVIVAGDIDLSFGSIMSLGMVGFIAVERTTGSVELGVLAALSVGGLVSVELFQRKAKQPYYQEKVAAARLTLEAMAFLKREGKFQHASRPDLILLDLNMTRKDGREVLREIKTHPDLKRIPVVILTTSQAEEDILSTYDLHANCYITKPVDFDRFLKVVRSIEDFWLTVVKLPPR